MGGNVREKLEEAPRIKIRGFNFRGEIFDCLMLSNVNFELGTRGEILPSTRIDGTLQCRQSNRQPPEVPIQPVLV